MDEATYEVIQLFKSKAGEKEEVSKV